MTCMRNDMLKEAAVMRVDPDWIISSHSLLKVTLFTTHNYIIKNTKVFSPVVEMTTTVSVLV